MARDGNDNAERYVPMWLARTFAAACATVAASLFYMVLDNAKDGSKSNDATNERITKFLTEDFAKMREQVAALTAGQQVTGQHISPGLLEALKELNGLRDLLEAQRAQQAQQPTLLPPSSVVGGKR